MTIEILYRGFKDLKESKGMIKNLNQTIYARVEGLRAKPDFYFDFDTLRYGYVTWECTLKETYVDGWDFYPDNDRDVASEGNSTRVMGGWLKGVIDMASSAMEYMTEEDFTEELMDYLSDFGLYGDIASENARELAKGMIHIGGWNVVNRPMFSDYGDEISDDFGDYKVLEAMLEAPDITECVTELKLARRESTRKPLRHACHRRRLL